MAEVTPKRKRTFEEESEQPSSKKQRLSTAFEVTEQTKACVIRCDDSRATKSFEYYEEALCKFIIDKIGTQSTESPIEAVRELITSNVEQVEQLCSEFVLSNHITHYTHSLTFEPSAYLVATSDIKEFKLHDVDATVDLAKIIPTGALLSSQDQKPEKAQEVPDGTSFDGREKKNPFIDVQLKPVSSLIQCTDLKKMVEKATEDYIATHYSKIQGYCIFCELPQNQKLFFKANEDGTEFPTLEVTTNPKNASVFHIVENATPLGMGFLRDFTDRVPNEFGITYSRKGNMGEQAPLYLNCPDDTSSPLAFKATENTRLALVSPLQKPGIFSPFKPVRSTEWIKGERLYINCKHQLLGKDSFICVKRAGVSPNSYEVGCSSSTDNHDGLENFMLFSLINPRKLK